MKCHMIIHAKNDVNPVRTMMNIKECHQLSPHEQLSKTDLDFEARATMWWGYSTSKMYGLILNVGD